MLKSAGLAAMLLSCACAGCNRAPASDVRKHAETRSLFMMMGDDVQIRERAEGATEPLNSAAMIQLMKETNSLVLDPGKGYLNHVDEVNGRILDAWQNEIALIIHDGQLIGFASRGPDQKWGTLSEHDFLSDDIVYTFDRQRAKDR